MTQQGGWSQHRTRRSSTSETSDADEMLDRSILSRLHINNDNDDNDNDNDDDDDDTC